MKIPDLHLADTTQIGKANATRKSGTLTLFSTVPKFARILHVLRDERLDPALQVLAWDEIDGIDAIGQ